MSIFFHLFYFSTKGIAFRYHLTLNIITSATSLPTNQPSPLISTALTSSSNSYQSYKFFANKKLRLCMKRAQLLDLKHEER